MDITNKIFNHFSRVIMNSLFGFIENEKIKKGKKLKSIIKDFKFNEVLLKYLLIINIIISTISIINIERMMIWRSYIISIKIKISQIGDTQIFRSDDITYYDKVPKPNEIYINNLQIKPFTSNFYYFEQIENKITFIWDDPGLFSLAYMFSECSNITEMEFITFDAPIIYKLDYMFSMCSSLISLNLSVFNTPRLSEMYFVFYGCSSLEYLNLENIKKPSVSDIFQGTSDKLIICSSNFDEWSNSYTRVKFNCFYKETQNDFNNCSIKDLNKILENKNPCKQCGFDYYKIPEKFINGLNNFRCFKSPEGYYLNKDELIYEECYSSCKTCEQKGSSTFHNCIKCKDNYIYKYTFDFSDYINCYNDCPDYYYLDEITNEKHCTRSCPENYSKLIFNIRHNV